MHWLYYVAVVSRCNMLVDVGRWVKSPAHPVIKGPPILSDVTRPSAPNLEVKAPPTCLHVLERLHWEVARKAVEHVGR